MVVSPIVGRPEIRDGRVFVPAYSSKAEDGTGRYYIGLVAKFVMIGDGTRTFGSGKDLVNGRQLEVFRQEVRSLIPQSYASRSQEPSRLRSW